MSNTTVRNTGASGIIIAPGGSLIKATIADSRIMNNGTASSDAGIVIRPTGGASANVEVSRTISSGNANGIFMDGSGGAGPSNLGVNESFLSNNSGNGIAIASGSSGFGAMVSNSRMSFNAGAGAAVANGAASLRLSGSTITGNVTGITNAGGTVQSFKNNVVAGNGTDGTPITAFPGPGGALQ